MHQLCFSCNFYTYKFCKLVRQILLKTWPGLSYQKICLDLKFLVNLSKNEDFRTRGQNQPLLKPCCTPVRNKVCQDIPYQKICLDLDLKFKINLVTNNDFMASSQNQPLPKPYLTIHPVIIGLIYDNVSKNGVNFVLRIFLSIGMLRF